LRVVSYNILAPSYIRPDWYPFTDRSHLAWEARQERLAARLLGFDGDVLCLQEVEPYVYEFLQGRLEPALYQGTYVPKSQGRPDGGATFYRSDRLMQMECRTLYFRDGAGGQDSGHLALVSTFNRQGSILHIVNTHIRWGAPEEQGDEHVGFRQVRELLKQLDALPPALACIICGDFNAEPESEIVSMIVRSGMRDAYAGAPQPTCNSNRHAQRIDYLFYRPAMEVVPMALPVIDDETPLPSADEPSDHLPIAADFGITMQSA
jgi:mRNA deadenylase 3'-5' endonuclease subunit Ccr4